MSGMRKNRRKVQCSVKMCQTNKVETRTKGPGQSDGKVSVDANYAQEAINRPRGNIFSSTYVLTRSAFPAPPNAI